MENTKEKTIHEILTNELKAVEEEIKNAYEKMKTHVDDGLHLLGRALQKKEQLTTALDNIPVETPHDDAK